MRNTILAFIAFLGIAVFLPGHAMAQEKSIVIASTTSTQDSGLYGHLLPIFTQMTGIAVKVLAQGTGQALDTARRGDADVVFVHAKFAELRFIAEGHGVKRFPVMYNDFVLVGPKSDPAGIKGMDRRGRPRADPAFAAGETKRRPPAVEVEALDPVRDLHAGDRRSAARGGLCRPAAAR